MIREDVGKHIRFLRIKNNLTQDELGKKINISRQSIAKIENSEGTYNIDKLINILEIFKEEIYIGSKNETTDKAICDIVYKIENALTILKPVRENIYGWIYIVKLESNDDIIKIGFTKEDKPEDRLNTMDCEDKCELYYARLVSNCRKTEKTIHDLFREFNIKGEWFKLNCKIAKIELDKMINKLDL